MFLYPVKPAFPHLQMFFKKSKVSFVPQHFLRDFCILTQAFMVGSGVKTDKKHDEHFLLVPVVLSRALLDSSRQCVPVKES